MKNIKFILAATFIVANSIQLWSCSNAIQITVNRTPECQLEKQQQFAITEVMHQNGETNTKHTLDLGMELTNKLAALNSLEVVDLSALNMQQEQKYQTDASSGLQTKNNMVLLSAKIITNEYSEDVEKKNIFTYPKGNTVTTFEKSGHYTYGVNFKMADSKTGKVLYSKTINCVKTQKITSPSQALLTINKSALYHQALLEVTQQFMHAVAPYTETVAVKFEKDGKLKKLNTAIHLLKQGQMEQSANLLSEMTTLDTLSPTARAKAYYNYGVILALSNRQKDATMAFQEAIRLDPKNDKYKNQVQ